MAATGNTPIQLYYSNTSGNIPVASNLLLGELAINVPDGKLFYLNSSNVVSVLASASDNVRITAAFSQANNAYNTANTKYSSSGGTINGNVNIVGTLAISSNTLVANLNASLLNNQPSSYYTNAGNLTGTINTGVLGSGTANANTYLSGAGTWKTIPAPYAFAPQTFTATASQTVFTISGGYTVGSIIVYQNGVKLLVGSDVTATDGTTIVLANPADSGDTVEVLKYDTIYSMGGGSGSSISVSNTALTATANGLSFQNGYISASGDSVTNQYILSGVTTNATETELLISGGKRIPVRTNTTVYYTVDVVARRTNAPDESAGFYVKGVADNFSGTVADVGALYEIIVARDDPNYSIDVRANNTTKTINMYVTGVAAKTIRWVANIQTVEVSQ